MNGTNGVNGAQHNDSARTQLFQALEVAHDPRARQETRQEAFQFLEQVKELEDAPAKGFELAADRSQSVQARHFGLSLLENAIKFRWQNYGEAETTTVRQWVLQLARGIQESDPLFIRNKIAQLWVEIAKRSWALDWMDMDQMLVEIWNGPAIQKVLVLEILETLSENSFGKEDTTTALRGQDLSKACVEIFTPEATLVKHFPGRDTTLNVRHGEEGWLVRISDFLGWCNEQGPNDSDVQLCTIKALDTLRSVVPWAILAAIASAKTVQVICQSLLSSKLPIQLAAVETLYGLYSRPHYTTEDVKTLVGPLYETETIGVLRGLYEWSIVDANDLEDEKYLLCKKLAELMHSVGSYMVTRIDGLTETADIPKFLELLFQITSNRSLHVSIPVLHLWAQLLRTSKTRALSPIMQMFEPLLNLCIERLIKYELFADDPHIPELIFLREDLDTIPERHAFLGNYARYCKSIVEYIVYKMPKDALRHILNTTDEVIQEAKRDNDSFDANIYKKLSPVAIQLEARVAAIEAALLGYTGWRADHYRRPNADVYIPVQNDINQMLEEWCRALSQQQEFGAPNIQQRVMTVISNFALDPLKKVPAFVASTFQYFMDMKYKLLENQKDSSNTQYQEDLKELQRFISHQIQRLSLKFADILIDDFSQIESQLHQICQKPQIDEEDRDRCIAALFMIVQRTTKLSPEEQLTRLDNYVSSTMSKWQNPQFREQMQSFDGFCNLLQIKDVDRYFSKQNATHIADWSTVPLDEEGKARKLAVDAAQQELPLRATSTFFSVSLDRTDRGTAPYKAAVALWAKYIPEMLELILQFISLSHMYSEPSTWNNGLADTAQIQARILKDRFWQVGISSGSRDDFYQRVEQSKQSMEGLASAIRGSLRLIRDKSYRLLATIAALGDFLYTIDGLAPILARSIFEHSSALTAHQIGMVIEMMRPVIENCPVESRQSFLTPVLIAMFDSLDHKVTTEWTAIEQKKAAASDDDDLQEEMKNESILRNLTYNCVSLIVRLLDPQDGGYSQLGRLAAKQNSVRPVPTNPIMREFILSTPSVFKSLILFCTHTLQMHDNRCCSTITKVLRSIITVFSDPNSELHAEVREFISTEVLKATILSLHDPYFIDSQSDLAHLIASIIKRYSLLTDAPRQLLYQLPNMDHQEVDKSIERICKETSSRVQRAVVLKLLEHLRGLTITEQGRIIKAEPVGVERRKPVKSALQAKYASNEGPDEMKTEDGEGNVKREHSPDLGGIADMFA